MDQNMWQTIIPFDLLHSSYMWWQTILLCGKHCRTMQIGTVSRLRFHRRSWRFKIWRNIVHFRKSYICSNKLDVQETNFNFTQFNRIWNHFFGWRIEVGRYSRSWYGIWSLQLLETRIRTEKNERGETNCWSNVKFVLHLTRFTNASNLREWSVIWIMLILFSSSCCKFLKNKERSRW